MSLLKPPVEITQGGTGAITAPAALTNLGALPLAGGTMTGDLILNANPTIADQAATKAYVDSVGVGVTFKSAVVASTTANLNAIYNNGGGGVGDTLTNNGALVAFSTDGISPSVNDRILVKDQTAQEENGIYEVTTVGSGAVAWVLTRTTDYDTPAEILPGTIVPVLSGTVNANTSWAQTETVAAVGTDPIIFSQFTYNAMTFLQVANNLSDLNNDVTARQNLGVEIGVDVEAWSGELDAVAALATTGVVSRTGVNTWSTSSITNHSVQVGDASNGLSQVAVGATNTVLLGNTGADPSFGTVPNAALTNSSVTLNSGNNITVTGGSPLALGGVASFDLTGTTNHAIQLGNASGSLSSLSLGSAGQVLQSAGAGSDPAFSTATYPSTTTINRILFSSANNVVSEITAANDGVLVSSHTGIPSWLANSGTAGWVLTANTNLPPSWQAPAASGITGTVSQYNVVVGDAGNTVTSVGPGSAGQILQSGGAAANPSYSTATYPSVATGTGTFLRANGTNWAASTSTIPNTNSQGDLLYGSASNVWTSLAKDTNSTRYLSNTGASNNPAWAQVSLTTGVTGTLPETNGGTNQSTYAQGDMLYSSAANTLSKLAKDTNATRYLSNTGTSNNPAWSQINLTNGVTGNLPIANRLTAVTSPGAYPYTTLNTDELIIVDTSSARTINLMSTPPTGMTYRIKDNVGSAASNNITIVPAAGNIDGSANIKITSAYGSVDLTYNGTQWNAL